MKKRYLLITIIILLFTLTPVVEAFSFGEFFSDSWNWVKGIFAEEIKGQEITGSETQINIPLSCGVGGCEIKLGENCASCPSDCGCLLPLVCIYGLYDNPAEIHCDLPPTTCGDGECALWENCLSCPSDCGCSAGYGCFKGKCWPYVEECGNKVCAANENCEICPSDCGCLDGTVCSGGACVPIKEYCGDSKCNILLGENCETCRADCGCAPGDVCYNGNCALIVSACGDSFCDVPNGEDCGSCAADCACSSEYVCYGRKCGPVGEACGNKICDVNLGEDCISCVEDCGCNPGYACYNGKCAPVISTCGDGICNIFSGERCDNCKDCLCLEGMVCSNGKCAPAIESCGDGQCNVFAGENCQTCEKDCECVNSICYFGKCVLSNPCIDIRCTENQVCVDGDCFISCTDDTQCPKSQDCLNNICIYPECGDNACTASESCGTCLNDCPCGEGLTCYQDECHITCEDDTQCPKSQDCLDNVCVYPECGDGKCTASENCADCENDCRCDPGFKCIYYNVTGNICVDELDEVCIRNEDCPIGEYCIINTCQEVEDPCLLGYNSGPCKATQIKYYFDQIDHTCKEFIWGGCNGIVPFDTLAECESSCAQQQQCINEGQLITGTSICCDGLNSVQQIIPEYLNPFAGLNLFICLAETENICVKCSDGICGLGENVCNCAADCECTTFNDCAAGNTCENGICVELSSCGTNGCDINLGENCHTCAVDCGCNGSDICSNGECNLPVSCVAEGQIGEILFEPNMISEQCCSNLNSINVMINESNGCIEVADTFMCAKCPDGICGLGENNCNCAADCGCKTFNDCPINNTCTNGICVELSSCGTNGCEANKSENCHTCVSDCGCINGICSNGVCIAPFVCGNGVCEASETCSNCSIDCGACTATGGGSVPIASSSQYIVWGRKKIVNNTEILIMPEQGPIYTTEVLPPIETPIEKKIAWWVWVAIGVGIIIGASLIALLVLRKGSKTKGIVAAKIVTNQTNTFKKDPKIEDFVKSAYIRGHKKSHIIAAMKKKGWPDNIIKEYIK